MDKAIRRKIEWAFYNYEKLKQQGAQYIAEIAESGLTVSYCQIGGHGNIINRPTENKALKHMCSDDSYKWCKVIENTMIAYKWHTEYEIVVAKYFKHFSRTATQLKFGISDRTYDYWIENVLLMAYQWALELAIF